MSESVAAVAATVPFKARIFCSGFMMAESAPAGKRVMSDGLARSTMMTCGLPSIGSREQMYRSDVMVQLEKVNCLRPSDWSCKHAKYVPTRQRMHTRETGR